MTKAMITQSQNTEKATLLLHSLAIDLQNFGAAAFQNIRSSKQNNKRSAMTKNPCKSFEKAKNEQWRIC